MLGAPMHQSVRYRSQVFGPAFRRNARWSVAQPVPEVAEADAAWEQVDAFYDFWFAFRSWREFPHADEEDVEQAESREERRCVALSRVKRVGRGAAVRIRDVRKWIRLGALVNLEVQSRAVWLLHPQRCA